MQPALDAIESYRSQGNVVPIWKEIMADLLTPVSAFLKISRGCREAFLLESVEGGESIARYSFLGREPFLTMRCRGSEVERIENGKVQIQSGDFFAELRQVVARYRTVDVEGLPPFTGGAVGYFGYDVVRLLEKLPDSCVDDLRVDDVVLNFYSTILAFDHVKHRIVIIANLLLDAPGSIEQKYEKARRQIERIEEELARPLEVPSQAGGQAASLSNLRPRSNFAKEKYLEAVDRAREYIAAGDIFQVVLSQRFEVDLAADPFDVYRALRFVNPSPYMFYLKLGDLQIAGASPEMLVRVQGSRLSYRPIAGTRKRGRSTREDEQLMEDLKRDEKEVAEHVMLVDLGRNDLGRVCRYGTVAVDQMMFIEKYSHVMHLVSSISGELRPELDHVEALKACFPAGTVSGAPKVRAMEIIDELEPSRRGVYAGAIGYIDFSGNLDSCIAIRTLVFKDGKAYMQAGGGIVADSVPENEFQETVNKSMALLKAVELAENNFSF